MARLCVALTPADMQELLADVVAHEGAAGDDALRDPAD